MSYIIRDNKTGFLLLANTARGVVEVLESFDIRIMEMDLSSPNDGETWDYRNLTITAVVPIEEAK